MSLPVVAEVSIAVKTTPARLSLLVDGQLVTGNHVLEQKILKLVGQHIAPGKKLTDKLTTEQAASHIGVSRPTLIKLLEEFEIPVSTTGKHRRIRSSDIEILAEKLQARRQKNLVELIELSENHEVYRLDYESNPLVK